MFCINCGKQMEDDSLFCPFCGKTQTANALPSNNVQINTTAIPNIILSNDIVINNKDENEQNDCPAYNFVMHFIGPAEPRDCDFTIVKNTDDDDCDDEDEIDYKETTASTVEKTFEYTLEEGVYTIYVNSYTREVKIENGKIVDFTFDCSGRFNQIYIKDRPKTNKISKSVPFSAENGFSQNKTPGTIQFTLHMIGPAKPVSFKYHIVRLSNIQTIDQGTAYAVSTDNKLTYRLTPGKYEVKIDRYTRIVNVGEANDVEFIFDCSHHFNSIQIIGDIKG